MLNEDFINWAFSNTLDNSLRGIVAEYLVHKAVGGIGNSRVNWDACDIEMSDGTKIEVKTSGYLQTWSQTKPSTLAFDISKKDPWLASENRFLGRKCRYADVWVFAIHTETDRDKAEPLDPTQWQFLVTTSKWLDAEFKDQKSVRYSILCSKGLDLVRYSDLYKTIKQMR
jgi:hypothetical protein